MAPTAEEEVSLFSQDWRLSQFWYSPEIATTVAEEVLHLCNDALRPSVVCIACPTLFAYLKKMGPDVSARLLEYDKRFEQYGDEFTFYDYNQPEDLPHELKHSYQIIVADPPYLDVANGFWVVLENIDQVPLEVHHILFPLMEGHDSFATSHGEEVQVSESFRLFLTTTCSKLDASNCFEACFWFVILLIASRLTLSSFWRRIMMIKMPSREELNNIVTTLYPDMEAIVPNIIGVSLEINKPFASGDVESVNSLQRFSLRDILKFCKRG